MARIMIVEDSSIMRKGMKAILQGAGHEVVAEAENGLAACEEHHRTRPDIITMDLVMPDMDGLEAIREIVAEDKKVRIVVISGLADKSKIIEALQSGACQYIIKPITDEKVIKAVTGAISMELSPQRQLEMVNLLETEPLQDDEAASYSAGKPPYKIFDQQGKYIQVEVGPMFSVAEARRLLVDIDEGLFAGQRCFLFDFGDTDCLEHQAFSIINQVVARILSEDGQIRALSCSSNFIRFVQSHEKAVSSGLAGVIRQVPAV